MAGITKARRQELAEWKEKGRRLGAEAFAKGIKSAPCLDPHIHIEIGNANNDHALIMALMKSWSDAWHAANLAAPVA
jgi:hypothetical protein